MNTHTVTNSTNDEEFHQAFLDQVPGRVNAILENWQQLVQGDWNRQQLTALLERLRTLAGTSERFQEEQIRSSGQFLFSHLSAYTGGHKPHHQEVVTLDGLVHAFKDVALEVCQPTAIKPPPASQTVVGDALAGQVSKVFLLGLDGVTTEPLKKQLMRNRFQVETLAVPGPLLEAERSTLSRSVVIAHIDWLQALFPADKAGGLWQQEGGMPGLPVAFIADTHDLQTRLAAIRTDAKAYWTLPIDPALVAHQMLELTSSDNHSPYRILIVEDDPAQADFASAILAKAHYECRCVTKPLQVLESLDEFRPDLILMDLYMPHASGCELTTVIREQSEFVDTPIVFLSGEQDLDKQLNALSCGGEDFLSKPIGPKHLIKTVANRIRRARQLSRRSGVMRLPEDASSLNYRNLLFERVEALLREKPEDGRKHAVFYLDMDNGEQVLNAVGIGGMDVVLTEIVNHIRPLLQPQDILGRFDEHSLGMVITCDAESTLASLGKRLCAEAANQVITVDNRTLGVTLSIGAYLIENDAQQDARSLFSRAKLACRAAHKAGGDRMHIQLPEQTQPNGLVDDSLASLLTRALREDYFEVYFQPIVGLKSAFSKAHYQTLIRLQEPDGRLLTAAEFIPTAVQLGLISKLDQWMTRSALLVINQHKQQGQEIQFFVSQAVDLLENMERLSWLREKHRRGLIGNHDLTFEFRLAEVASQLNSAKVCFQMLNSMGIDTLLSGTDGSAESLRTLNNLPVQYIKLDNRLLQEPDRKLKELIALAQSLEIKVIAPRVEDPRSIALLWSNGVDFVQGNFVQRPERNLRYDFHESILN